MALVGDILRKARMHQRRTLKEASDELNIKEAYLTALENNDFSKIPGEVFVKGFIRNYGAFLGLNGPALVQEYKRNMRAEKKPAEPEKMAPAVSGDKEAKREKLRRKQGKWPEIMVVAGILLFLLLCLWLFF